MKRGFMGEGDGRVPKVGLEKKGGVINKGKAFYYCTLASSKA